MDSYEILGALEGLILVWTKWPWVQGLRPLRTHTVTLAGELYWSAGEGLLSSGCWAPQEHRLVSKIHQELHQPGLERWDSILKMGSTSSQQRPARGQPGPKSHTGVSARDLMWHQEDGKFYLQPATIWGRSRRMGRCRRVRTAWMDSTQ